MSIESSTTATIYEQQQPSASRVVEDPALVVDWSVAIQQANLHRVQRLLRSHPDLLWTPLTAWDPERDASHVISQLKTVQHLGSSLDNLCAIHYALLQYNEPVPGEKSTLAQLQTGNLLWFLIESATKQDLENQPWGNCNNRTLHLVSFLGHQQVARRLLDDKSVSTEIPNDLGFFARDVALSDDLFHLLSPINMMDDDKRRGGLARKHQHSSNDRFNQLRQLAETTPSAHKNINSTRQAEGRYFRSGHVAESKRKVLSEEEAELEKQRLRRQQEVAMLAKRSAVKNNPLFKRFEQQQQKQHKRPITNNTTVALSKSGSATEIASDNNNSNSANNPTTNDEESTAADVDVEEPKKKRNSKVISALRNKSIVSSSVFLQTEPERASSPAPAPRSPQLTPSVEDSSPKPTTIPSKQHSSKDNSTTTTAAATTKDADNVTQVKELSEEEATRMDRRRLSGSQKSQWALGMNSWASIMERSHLDTLSSDDDNVSEGEQWFDSKEFEADEIRNEVKQPPLHQNEPTQQPLTQQPHLHQNEPTHQPPIDNIESTPASNFDTTPSSSPSSSSLSSPILESYPTSSSSISPASTITTPPVQVAMERSPDNVHDDVSYGSISVSTTSRYVRRLSQAQNPALLEMQHRQEQQPCILDDDTKQSKFKIKRVPVKVPSSVSKLSSSTTKQHDPPTIRRSQSALQSLGSTVPASISLSKHSYQPKASRHGKLYLRINAATDMLLPLPNEPTYVRCVVSDDRYEYMSRYALLGQHIPFEYECIIDTNDDPDMIITISLHVRPDHHLRSKLPLTRLFSTNKKHHHHDKGGSLSSYICHDDGSIGRSRFALSHMLHGCYMCSYSTRFDCFNAWTQQRQKHRSKEEGDVLKVIGSLEIEMLYLPLNDPSMSVPRNLRDCDMAIKIQQWNETCWNTENLTSSRTSKMPDTTGNGLMKNLQPTRSPSLF